MDYTDLIIRFLSNNTTATENLMLRDWLNQSEENRIYFNTIRNIWLASAQIDPDSVKTDKETEPISSSESHTEERVIRKLKIWHYSAAAFLIVTIGLGIVFYLSGVFKSSSVAYIEATSPQGTKTKIVLADSSVVYLNAGSVLKYPVTFKNAKREVELSGEAYFEVKKDANHQFIVHTTQIDVQVFGTHFNVKAYPEDKNSVATLVEGSVGIYNKLSKNKETIKLKPNQQAICNMDGDRIELREVDASLFSGWKNDRYYFENETFASVARDIERNFNVIIQINYDELRHERFTGLLDKKKPVYTILDGMAQYGNFVYKLRNDTIIIQKK